MTTPAVVLAHRLATILKCSCGVLIAAGAMTGAAAAADAGFVGAWSLNPSATRLPDQFKVEPVSPNKYGFDFEGGGFAETIVADGTDQPGVYGTTFSVTSVGPNRWTVVRKLKGKVLLVAHWTLSPDGNSLHDDFNQTLPGGGPFEVDYLYRRTAAGPGFVGAWNSTQATVKSAFELQIQPYKGDGLAFSIPTEALPKNFVFDGRDYTYAPVNAALTSSIRRIDALTLEVTDKIGGKLADTQEFRLSPDHKRLTMTIQPPGAGRPEIYVFDRRRTTAG